MTFKETELKGAYIIELEKKRDERGFFAHSFCRKEFEKHGLDTGIAQCSISSNKKMGTVRGMHYQIHPYEEVKIVTCIRGAIYDVVIDLRKDSPTYLRWLSVHLNAKDHNMLYIPKGFAHGFQTLEDDTTIFYQISEFYHPECGRGVRWNDPAFGVKWPLDCEAISKKDKELPDYNI